MNGNPPSLSTGGKPPEIRKHWRGTVVTVIAPVITVLGSLGGAYLGAQASKPAEPPKAQYELWTPSSLPADNKQLIIFRVDKASGDTWQLVETTDNARNVTQRAWSLVANPVPNRERTAEPGAAADGGGK
jgi:hypothetical protein